MYNEAENQLVVYGILTSFYNSVWLLWLNNGSNYGTHCCTSMGSTIHNNGVVSMVTKLNS
jgi:hypothetical protein